MSFSRIRCTSVCIRLNFIYVMVIIVCTGQRITAQDKIDQLRLHLQKSTTLGGDPDWAFDVVLSADFATPGKPTNVMAGLTGTSLTQRKYTDVSTDLLGMVKSIPRLTGTRVSEYLPKINTEFKLEKGTYAFVSDATIYKLDPIELEASNSKNQKELIKVTGVRASFHYWIVQIKDKSAKVGAANAPPIKPDNNNKNDLAEYEKQLKAYQPGLLSLDQNSKVLSFGTVSMSLYPYSGYSLSISTGVGPPDATGIRLFNPTDAPKTKSSAKLSKLLPDLTGVDGKLQWISATDNKKE